MEAQDPLRPPQIVLRRLSSFGFHVELYEEVCQVWGSTLQFRQRRQRYQLRLFRSRRSQPSHNILESSAEREDCSNHLGSVHALSSAASIEFSVDSRDLI